MTTKLATGPREIKPERDPMWGRTWRYKGFIINEWIKSDVFFCLRPAEITIEEVQDFFQKHNCNVAGHYVTSELGEIHTGCMGTRRNGNDCTSEFGSTLDDVCQMIDAFWDSQKGK